MKELFKDFKIFLLRGNVVDLAVAVVIGAAFSGVVTALVKDLVTPLIAAIGGKPDFSALSFTLNHSQFLYGDFLNQLISFAIVAAVIFFFVIHPMNLLIKRFHKTDASAAAKDLQLQVLEEIRDILKAKAAKK